MSVNLSDAELAEASKCRRTVSVCAPSKRCKAGTLRLLPLKLTPMGARPYHRTTASPNEISSNPPASPPKRCLYDRAAAPIQDRRVQLTIIFDSSAPKAPKSSILPKVQWWSVCGLFPKCRQFEHGADEVPFAG